MKPNKKVENSVLTYHVTVDDNFEENPIKLSVFNQ